jgi:hypothetical protein
MGLGHDADIQELFAYIATLEDQVATLGQYYEEFIIPDLQSKTWTEARAYEKREKRRGR